jgi:hypothetical protein
MPQTHRRAIVVCRVSARIINTVLASVALGLVASKLYSGGHCYTLSHTLPCHWLFVTASFSIVLALGYALIDFFRMSQENLQGSNEFEGILLKTSVCVSAILTAIWVTSACLLVKQYADYQGQESSNDEDDNVDYPVTILGIVTIAWCFATSIAWLSLTVFEVADLRNWLYEFKLHKEGWGKLPTFEFEPAEVACNLTNCKTNA